MKKVIHKFKKGDIATFKWFTDEIITGVITKTTYMGERCGLSNYNQPDYTITVERERRMKYPGVHEHRILEVNGEAQHSIFVMTGTKNMYEPKKRVTTLLTNSPVKKVQAPNELDREIKKQKDFLDGNVKN